MDVVPFDEIPFDYCTRNHCISDSIDTLFVHESDHGGLSFSDIVGCNADYPGSIDISNPPAKILEICGPDDRTCLLEGILGGVKGANICKEYKQMMDTIQKTSE